MYPILEKVKIAEDACLLRIRAEHVAKGEPGQFVMVQHTELSEPVPLSILEIHKDGFSCLVKAVGRSTLELVEEAKDLYYVAGPLGKPFPVKKYGVVAFYTFSWGIAPALNVARALKEHENKLLLCHTSEDFYLKEKAMSIFDEFFSLDKSEAIRADLFVTTGSNQLPMELSSLHPQTPIVSMVNTHMLDAVGLCLVCRILVDGAQKLACVDGPWFEAHKVDWASLMDRERAYQEQEKVALEEYKKMLKRKSLRS
ncbi:MAG: oxidoreductase [Aquificaceae bacterium]|nr:oxidoreductase [Aquificaceae bacterium]